MLKHNLFQKVTLLLLVLLTPPLENNSAFAQSAPIAWGPSYQLKSGHTIYLNTFTGVDNGFSGCVFPQYIDINGTVTEMWYTPQIILTPTTTAWQYSNSNLTTTTSSSSPMWYTATTDTTISIGASNTCGITTSFTGGSFTSPSTPNTSAGAFSYSGSSGGYGYSETINFYETWNPAPPTGSVTINNGVQYTSSTSVTLNLTATPASGTDATITNMSISNDQINWYTETWPTGASSTNFSWLLGVQGATPAPGTIEKVYVKFEDSNNSWSQVYPASITYAAKTLVLFVEGIFSDPNNPPNGVVSTLTSAVQNANLGNIIDVEAFPNVAKGYPTYNPLPIPWVGTPRTTTVQELFYFLENIIAPNGLGMDSSWVDYDNVVIITHSAGYPMTKSAALAVNGITFSSSESYFSNLNGLYGSTKQLMIQAIQVLFKKAHVLSLDAPMGGSTLAKWAEFIPNWTRPDGAFNLWFASTNIDQTFKSEITTFDSAIVAGDPLYTGIKELQYTGTNTDKRTLLDLPQIKLGLDVAEIASGKWVNGDTIETAGYNVEKATSNAVYPADTVWNAIAPNFQANFLTNTTANALTAFHSEILYYGPLLTNIVNTVFNAALTTNAINGIPLPPSVVLPPPNLNPPGPEIKLARPLVKSDSVASTTQDIIEQPFPGSTLQDESSTLCPENAAYLSYVYNASDSDPCYLQLTNDLSNAACNVDITNACNAMSFPDADSGFNNTTDCINGYTDWNEETLYNALTFYYTCEGTAQSCVPGATQVIDNQPYYCVNGAWTPTLGQGQTCSANDQCASNQCSTTCQGDGPLQSAPVFTTIDNQSVSPTGSAPLLTATTGNNLQFLVTANSPVSKTITYSVSNLPAGANLNFLTGSFSWTPQTGQNGTFNVFFTAQDSNGLTSIQPVQIVAGTGINPTNAVIVGSIAANSSLPIINYCSGSTCNTYSVTNTPTVGFDLSATETGGLGISYMQLSSDATHWGVVEPYSNSGVYTLPSVDGTFTVYAKFIDVTGNVSPVYFANVMLDTIPPTGSFTINGGAEYADTSSVTLNLSATDNLSGVHNMAISNDGINWTIVPYTTNYTWTLASTTSGAVDNVFVKYEDNAQNWSAVYSATINFTPDIANILNVTLVSAQTGQALSGYSWGGGNTITVTGPVQVSANPGTFPNFQIYNLAAGTYKTVINLEGKIINYSFIISANLTYNKFSTLDIPVSFVPPSAPVLTAQTGVSPFSIVLNWTVPADIVAITGYELVRNGTTVISGSGFVPIPGNTWTDTNLTSGATYSYQVYVQDQDGNSSFSNKVTVTTPYIVNTTVTGGSGVITCNDSPCPSIASAGTTITFSANPAATWTVQGSTPGAGCSGMSNACTVTITNNTIVLANFICIPNCSGKSCGSDGCGGSCSPGCTSPDVCSTSYQCVNAPTGSIKINKGALYTDSTAVTLTLAATDAVSKVANMRISNDQVNWTTVAYKTSYAWNLPSTLQDFTAQTVYVQFENSLGNWSSIYSASISLDTPIGSFFFPTEPVQSCIDTTKPVLTLAATDPLSGVTKMALSNSGTTWTTVAYATSYAWTVTPNVNMNVYVKFENAAGFWSPVYTNYYVYDSSVPAGSFQIDDGATSTNSRSLILTFNAGVDGTCGMFNMSIMGPGKSITVPISSAYTWTLPSSVTTGETATFIVQFQNGAGTWGTSIHQSIKYTGT